MWIRCPRCWVLRIVYCRTALTQRGRRLRTSRIAGWLKRMQKKMATDESRAHYGLRKQTVRPVCGIIKQAMGFRQFLLRGSEKMEAEWALVTLAYNCKRMPDGDHQGDFYRYAVEAAREHFRPRPEAYVTGDHFIYLEEVNTKNCIAPDLYVVMNGGHRMRDTYKLWEEPGGFPDLVLEIVSPSTWRTDLDAKRNRYAALGVGEYWLHDPHANFKSPALAGYRLFGRSYKPIPGVESSDGTLTIH